MSNPNEVGDLGDRIAEAVGRVRLVRTVGTVRLGTEAETGRPLVAVRIGLTPATPLSEVVTVIARAQLAAARLAPRGAFVFVEPDIAADETTPTESIVIRALE